MKSSIYHVLAAGLVVGQTLILSLSPACSMEVSEKKTNDTVSISTSSKENPQTNPNLSTKTDTSISDNEKVITAEASSSTSSVIEQPSTRIPISSRIFNHPSMQQ